MRRDLNIDWLTLFLYFLLIGLGWFNLYSTSIAEAPDAGLWDLHTYHGKQLLFIAISVGLGAVIILLDNKFLEFLSYGIYGASLLLLFSVFVLGTKIKGANSWIQFGGFSLQPSEFMKVATLMALGKYMSRHNFSMKRPTDIAVCAWLVLVPMLTILLQNDAGSMLVFTALILMFFREGMHPLFLVGIAVTALVGIASILLADSTVILISMIAGFFVVGLISLIAFRWRFLLIHILAFLYLGGIVGGVLFAVEQKIVKDYHRARIVVLAASEERIKEDKNLQKVYYNLRESKVAIGSGGLTGKGYGNSTHTRGDFVPEEHTDYIFCVVGEEHGFVGSAGLLILYFLFIARLIYLAENSKSKFAEVYGYGAASIFFIHLFVNIGMTLGLVPTVGIPLPFFSYGGSSFIAFSIMTFLLINQYSHRVNVLGGKELRQS